ncbi:hypothetical protein GW17_00057047, partial [Ensete ventricosum]
RWVVLPGWEPVVAAGNGVAVEFVDGRVLPWRGSGGWEKAVLVVADRGRREVGAEDGYYLVGGEEGRGKGLGVERGGKLMGKGVKEALGTVVLVHSACLRYGRCQRHLRRIHPLVPSSGLRTLRNFWLGFRVVTDNFLVKQESLKGRVSQRRGHDGRRQLVVRSMAKDIAFDQSSRSSLQSGVEKLANAVGVTLGPRGARGPSLPPCHSFIPWRMLAQL